MKKNKCFVDFNFLSNDDLTIEEEILQKYLEIAGNELGIKFIFGNEGLVEFMRYKIHNSKMGKNGNFKMEE